MPKKPEKPPEDPNLAAFRAILAKKKANISSIAPKQTGFAHKGQKPRPKERMRRRP